VTRSTERGDTGRGGIYLEGRDIVRGVGTVRGDTERGKNRRYCEERY